MTRNNGKRIGQNSLRGKSAQKLKSAEQRLSAELKAGPDHINTQRINLYSRHRSRSDCREEEVLMSETGLLTPRLINYLRAREHTEKNVKTIVRTVHTIISLYGITKVIRQASAPGKLQFLMPLSPICSPGRIARL